MPCSSSSKKPSTHRKTRREQRVEVKNNFLSRRAPVHTRSRTLFLPMYLYLQFAPHPPRLCLPSRCRWIALRHTLLTHCDTIISHRFDNNFKDKAHHDNIPDGDAMGVNGSHVS